MGRRGAAGWCWGVVVDAGRWAARARACAATVQVRRREEWRPARTAAACGGDERGLGQGGECTKRVGGVMMTTAGDFEPNLSPTSAHGTYTYRVGFQGCAPLMPPPPLPVVRHCSECPPMEPWSQPMQPAPPWLVRSVPAGCGGPPRAPGPPLPKPVCVHTCMQCTPLQAMASGCSHEQAAAAAVTLPHLHCNMSVLYIYRQMQADVAILQNFDTAVASMGRYPRAMGGSPRAMGGYPRAMGGYPPHLSFCHRPAPLIS